MLMTLSPRVVLRAEPFYFDQYSVFNARNWKTFNVSPAQFALLRALAVQPVEDGVVCSQIDEAATADGISAQTMIENDILVYADESTQPRSIPDVPAVPIYTGTQCMDAPSRLELCITRRCNEVCHHCNISATSENAPEKQPISFWLGIVDQCIDLGILKVTLTGGEPFLRKDFNLLLEKLARSPIATSILTNGLAISDQQIDVMKRASMSLGISLDGAEAQEHDEFRRTPGAFDRTLATMKRLGEAGIIFTITVTVHSKNINDLPKFLEIGKSVGADTMVFGPMGGVGRGATAPAQKYHAPVSEVWNALQEIIAIGKQRPDEGPKIVVANYQEREVLLLQQGKIMSRRHPGLCKAGIFALAIDEDGMMYPCLRGLQTRVHPIGNLNESSMYELWRSKRWACFRNKKMPLVPCRIEAIEEASQRHNPLQILA